MKNKSIVNLDAGIKLFPDAIVNIEEGSVLNVNKKLFIYDDKKYTIANNMFHYMDKKHKDSYRVPTMFDTNKDMTVIVNVKGKLNVNIHT